VNWHPLRRARHIRWRALRALEDAQRANVALASVQTELLALRAAIGGSDAHVAELERGLARIESQLAVQSATQHEVRRVTGETQRDLERNSRVLELIYEEEMRNVRELSRLRQTSVHAAAFDESEPLVSVIIPTYLQGELLVTRAIPSVLGQTYANIEVVVVGDGAPESTAEAIARLDDPRVRYANLTVRAPYPSDPSEFWRVAGTPPWNAAWELARGQWIAPLNDDDAFRPEHVERLLDAARTERCEVAYGAIECHRPDGANEILRSWPPESHRFGWQAAIVHAGLGFMPMQLGSGALGTPGDWSLCRRMLRAGVSFTKVDDVVVDYYPSRLWDPEQDPAHG
jgi:uncharacterized coiled-coil protein SlyX